MEQIASVASEVEKLDELRKRGIISDVEFQVKKTALLAPVVHQKKGPRPGTFLAFAIIIAALAIGGASGGGGLAILFALVTLSIYFLPAMIAYQRYHSDSHAVLVINLFLGWSIIGWVVALIWASTGSKKT